MNTTLEGSVLRTNVESESSSWNARLGRFALLVVGGLVVFLPTVAFSPMLSRSTALVIRTGTSIAFLALALALRRSASLHKYWRLALSYFVASASLLFAWFLSGPPMDWLNLSLDTPTGIAFAKLSESFFVVFGIIVITLMFRADLGSIYLKRGNLKLGLSVGIISFIVLAGLAILQATNQGITLEQIIQVAPWILVFIFANAFEEELLYRGIFLRPFARAIGRPLAILATSLVFMLAHLEVTYTPDLLFFLPLVFVLALVWGWLIQRTDSLIASILFHAGGDTLIVTAIFASYGASL